MRSAAQSVRVRRPTLPPTSWFVLNKTRDPCILARVASVSITTLMKMTCASAHGCCILTNTLHDFFGCFCVQGESEDNMRIAALVHEAGA